MNSDWNFDKIGKRMPYTLPENSFTKLENGVWQQLEPKHKVHRKPHLRMVLRTVATVAAVVALILALNGDFGKNGLVGHSDITAAFDKLSIEDQNYLLEIYQDDIFINQ